MDEIESRLQTAQAHLRGAMEWISKATEENQRRLALGVTAYQLAQPTAKQVYDAQHIKHGDLSPSLAKAVTYPQPNDWAMIVPVESDYLASFGPNVKEHRRVASTDELRAAGIGTVEQRHPIMAEADRIIGTELHPLAGSESRL
jgi:hypothetical protein